MRKPAGYLQAQDDKIIPVGSRVGGKEYDME